MNVRVLEKSWRSPGNLFLKKGTNPVILGHMLLQQQRDSGNINSGTKLCAVFINF